MLPTDGFLGSEFEARVERAQTLMAAEKLDGLLLTFGDNIRYFTGVDADLGASLARPWFVVVPASGAPIAIVPSLAEGLMRKTWIQHIRSWPSPRPEDEGTTLVVDALASLPRRFGRVASEFGLETRIGLPLSQLNEIIKSLSGVELVDGASLIWSLRMIKSDAEVAKIQRATDIAAAVFAQVPHFVHLGDSERMIHQRFRIKLLEEGASGVGLTCRAGPGGPSVVTAGSVSDRRIADGDLLYLDTGVTHDHYFCDYDRNYQVGRASDALLFAHERVWEAHEAGLRAAVPGKTAGNIFEEMAKVLSSGRRDLNSNGRMGHGLGLRVTEPPSVKVGDNTVLRPGMVLCIEPALEYEPGKIVLHEETVVVMDEGARLITPRTPRELPQII
ncbi:Xaa-Pro peptidase family protein [Mesorhizobium sp.]|uniref:M24 family metallopeptidase n=1 Tax=Mesorhizobium sp. TaxID=1871066 RepID=UPI001219A933|nr:Xaa-Pro peptidase family protein [Mesorhizobium sp.]TIV55930.1 MAG: aminopeptidase P family protein [Mesorhizobium sp.]